MAATILVLNAGSSSIKFQLFAVDGDDRLARRLKGQIDGIGTRPKLRVKGKDGEILIDSGWPADAVGDVPAALDRTVAWLQQQLGNEFPSAIGHRVAHGGPDFFEPTMIDDAVLDRLARLVPLAPLHQPNNLAPIRAVRLRRPDMPQVACFDTAFHHRHSEVAQRYAIPDELHREGVRRYGFHGLSYEFIAASLPRVAPAIAGGRVVVAHLGSGASMCAIDAGRSIDSTMGFTALDGLPMGTRTGQIDPGVLLYLLTTKNWDVARLERFLYQECGLKGLSGVSNDMRDLLASDAPLAKIAVDYFVHRIQRETAALAAAMGGIDGLVFTGGIGENAAPIRGRVCEGLAWLGLGFDAAANARHGPCISTADSRLSAWVIPTDEERMIARHTYAASRRRSAA
ncbi:MAG: acetate/propionate family kinase [Dongiaceae bacterium]